VDGIPIDIAAVMVWQVTDTAQALFAVDDFAAFVDDAGGNGALSVAYPYDAHEGVACTDESPRSGPRDRGARVASAGVPSSKRESPGSLRAGNRPVMLQRREVIHRKSACAVSVTCHTITAAMSIGMPSTSLTLAVVLS